MSQTNLSPITVEPSKSRKKEKMRSVQISRSASHKGISSTSNLKSNVNEELVDSEDRPSKRRKITSSEIEVDISAPEPPSKKELRRLKKGKSLVTSKPDADASAETSTGTEKPEVKPRSEHGVWIGNLSFGTSKDDLKQLFVKNSSIQIESITRVHMPGPNESKNAKHAEKPSVKKINNKGFAYIDFTSEKDVEEAIALSEHLLGGRRLLIKNSKSFEGRPEKQVDSEGFNGKAPSTRIFIGNLGFDVTEEDVTQHFSVCGSVQSVKLATFEDSGKCKGYGWIVFEELEAAKHAIKGFLLVAEATGSVSGDTEDSANEAEQLDRKKPPKTRKQWVNRIKGRSIRTEYAEDAQTRYKKRYGKEGTKNPEGAEAMVKGVSESNTTKAEEAAYRQPWAPRLTGGIVESQGTKKVF